MIVHCIQHSDRVEPSNVAVWAQERGVELRVIRIYADEQLPAPEQVERLVILGGEMNTDQVDRHPWLDAEREFLTAMLARPDARMFGICLGSQLLAEVLGGSVRRFERGREIGWHEIELTEAGRRSAVFGALPARTDAFEWHGDSWSLPPGATLAATGPACEHQAFEWDGRVFGVQFHPEFSHARMSELVATTRDDLTAGGLVQSPEQFLADPARFDQLREHLDVLLDAALLQRVAV